MKRNNFSLVELLVVIGIIALLAAIILPVLNSSRKRARRTACMSNLKQFGLACISYRSDYSRPKPQMPPWISTLYDDYCKSIEVFSCPSDGNPKGTSETDWDCANGQGADYKNAFDRKGNTNGLNANPNGVLYDKLSSSEGKVGTSYFYEFNDCKLSATTITTSSWGWGTDLTNWGWTKNSSNTSWQDYKTLALKKGSSDDTLVPFKSMQNLYPIIRCWWHFNTDNDAPVVNVSYGGNVFMSYGSSWEKVWQP